MAAEISIICGKPIDRVIEIYQADKAKGWGYIAKEFGIKPGSAEFKALKGKANTYSGNLKNKNMNKPKNKKKK